MGRVRAAAAALALLAGACGDDAAGGEPVDVCTATQAWQAALAEAANDFTRSSRGAADAEERRQQYLDAFDEMRSRTDDLIEEIGERDRAVADALQIAVELLAEAHTAAEALGNDAYAVRRVPGGSLFTASERARATVLSAARPACS